jgi:hypothetical protein
MDKIKSLAIFIIISAGYGIAISCVISVGCKSTLTP